MLKSPSVRGLDQTHPSLSRKFKNKKQKMSEVQKKMQNTRMKKTNKKVTLATADRIP